MNNLIINLKKNINAAYISGKFACLPKNLKNKVVYDKKNANCFPYQILY